MLVRLIFAVTFLVSLGIAHEGHAHDAVLDLQESTFKQVIGAEKAIMVKFYAPCNYYTSPSPDDAIY